VAAVPENTNSDVIDTVCSVGELDLSLDGTDIRIAATPSGLRDRVSVEIDFANKRFGYIAIGQVRSSVLVAIE
jgi:hypothetical protein